jgi:hypothetical protein
MWKTVRRKRKHGISCGEEDELIKRNIILNALVLNGAVRDEDDACLILM